MARTRKQTAAHWEPLDAIEPWADNPRDNADNVARVAASIERFGFGAPVVANKRDGQIIAGHTRLLAAKHLGLDKVPVRWLDLEPDEAHALALADNRLNELSQWDDAALDAVLAELQQNAPDLVPLTGFDPEALATMLEPEEPPEQHDDPDTWDGEVEATAQAGDEIDLGRHRLVCGDCVAEMRKLPDGSVDAIVTDPPYGLGFMGKEWDALPPGPKWAEQCLRVLRPGGHVVAFGGTRTVHRLAVALEDAGFEIRDTIHWCYWSGFPKSLNLGEGRGTALKPALEPAILARKPMPGTVADCVQEHGTGALNIDACRIAPGDKAWPGPNDDGDPRWPANLYHCPKPATAEREAGTEGLAQASAGELTGGRAEGSAGLNSPRAGAGRTSAGRGNIHPTVKPVALMRWLVRLVTPPGGTVLEPFAGSGTTLVACEREGFAAIGIEVSPEYCDIIRARVQHAIAADRK
ncbi:DNA modification methylase [Acinetobacter sp.]|uniref:DNA modification methylase n=1 Tax=Acinetobacter sp. TaxID=472 RepID=UPI000C097F94|nr:DNA modification methylase [Acinetobacter sp.]MAK31353.1 hypothetical protein [Acinetobacter sp.]